MNQILTEQEYTEAYLQKLIEKSPQQNYQIIEPLRIRCENKDLVFEHYLYNSFIEYQSNPSSLEEILERFISATATENEAKEINKNNIIPVIKESNYLKNLRNLTGLEDVNIDFIYEEYLDGLIILYAWDNQNNISPIHEDEFKELNIQKSELRELAITNLENRLPDIEAQGNEQLAMLVAGGNYESSLILFDHIWSKENFPVKGNIVITIPARDLLLITGSEDFEGLNKMKEIATDAIENANYALIDTFFERVDNHWLRFQM